MRPASCGLSTVITSEEMWKGLEAVLEGLLPDLVDQWAVLAWERTVSQNHGFAQSSSR